MRFVSLAIAVAALILTGGSVPGAMNRVQPQVKVTASPAWWQQSVRITYANGSWELGYIRWWGWADSPVSPTVWVSLNGWTQQWPSLLVGARIEVIGQPYPGI
jgi:hypothetical protein